MRYFRKILGKYIYLSPINVDDVEIYTKWLNDKEVSGNLGNFKHIISTFSEQKTLERMSSEGYNFSIVGSEDDVLIGNISLNQVDNINRSATVGLFIGEAENRCKGYGSEALCLILNFGFNTLNLHNIMLKVHADNEQAIACYKKAGFREFGRRHEAKFKDGNYIDIIHMEILDSSFNVKHV
ncbi:MAG: GNAT family N-acetyltransferase [Firmicutes bacterium HGW-Firmicutes-21]|nr:MAG: GNAT family N-acetyltransferase [Firmicutes bacterium HGW-Firmicutes-21]